MSQIPANLIRSRMPELDTLRGIAISGVLLLHGFYWRYSDLQFTGLTGLLFRATAWGWVGVNLFFVLSGFLITGILLDARNDDQYYRRFYVRRALRILPAYYGLLAVLAVLRQASLPYVGISLVYLANLTTLFGISNDYGPLWSLAVEEHYYLFWPMVVRRLNAVSVGALAVFICATVPFLRMAAFRLGTVEGLSTYTWLVGDGLATGSVVACLLRIHSTRRGAIRLCAVIVAAAAFGLTLGVPWGITTRTRPLGAMFQFTVVNLFCAGLLLLFLLLGTSRWRGYVNFRAVRFLGYISYGLYLIHLLVFRLYDQLCGSLFPNLQPDGTRFRLMVLRFLIAATAATSLAYLSRRHFEERFLRLKDRFTPAFSRSVSSEPVGVVIPMASAARSNSE